MPKPVLGRCEPGRFAVRPQRTAPGPSGASGLIAVGAQGNSMLQPVLGRCEPGRFAVRTPTDRARSLGRSGLIDVGAQGEFNAQTRSRPLRTGTVRGPLLIAWTPFSG